MAIGTSTSQTDCAAPEPCRRMRLDALLNFDEDNTCPPQVKSPVVDHTRAGALPLPKRRCCERCSKRKIRCDRRTPCLNCDRAGTKCTVARQSRDAKNDHRVNKKQHLQIPRTELIDRLAELEQKLLRLGQALGKRCDKVQCTEQVVYMPIASRDNIVSRQTNMHAPEAACAWNLHPITRERINFWLEEQSMS
ncbi:hypothetical protein PFICI_08567 [Pestalotiopsis fici W106-1]|uniref:Zn(2)-C6 fungal-type domain-containing protein n=1 Tax=Pestalotiopsis fici (strain W106-1 / CGMCC3.15140) TaxID=1229662 RepID=W3WY58_PESFW|nr:uncharacterized protein PFICI_08567 [Pestalotiopsis fici W106-1]ETS78714.1 hypothetical protein PFICI_08567 [Pestalotiopsis fici W106-1]